jgi:hypothetical protein
MVKTLVLHREDTKVIYCLGGGEEIQLNNAVIRITFPETARQIKTISFGTQEEADSAFKEIQDWLASTLAQLVMEL